MKLVMIRLGRMGSFMVKRFHHTVQPVAGYNRSHDITNEQGRSYGFTPVYSLNEIVRTLSAIRHGFDGHAMLIEGVKLK